MMPPQETRREGIRNSEVTLMISIEKMEASIKTTDSTECTIESLFIHNIFEDAII